MTNKSIPNRIFWTWDHSTTWCKNALGAQNCGVANAYTKTPETFEVDYKRAIDFCAEHKFNAIGIVGLLRDRHGGVDSVRRLCSYAMEKGVRIYMIAGLYAYGGIYYEGDHKYSLDRFFAENPDCVGKYPDGTPIIFQYSGSGGFKAQAQGCPSNQKLNDFALESLDWLFKEIPELGGIQMESGDCGVCQCPECQARRGEESEYMSVADMAKIYPAATDVILKRSPDALVICESYHHFIDEACKLFESPEPSEDLKKIYSMPENVFWQWKCDEALRDGTWTGEQKMLKPLQKFNHVMRAHSGTQWKEGRATFAVDKIRRQCNLSYLSGLNGVSMFGETSLFHANAEFNYLAMEYFADNPFATNEDYILDVMAPKLGGKEFAEFYFDSAVRINEPEKIPAITTKIAKIASDVSGDYEAMRRWQYLASFLNGYYWESLQKGEAEKKKIDEGAIGMLTDN